MEMSIAQILENTTRITPRSTLMPTAITANNGTTPKHTMTVSPAFYYPFVILYVLVTFLGICGNGLVWYLFATKKVKHRPFNLQLLNLSVTDLFADIVVYPFIIMGMDYVIPENMSTRNANILCAIKFGLNPFWSVTYVSIWTLTFISVFRFLRIKFPLKKTWVTTKQGTVSIIVLIWLICITVSLPGFIFTEYDSHLGYCVKVWPAGFDGSAYILFMSIIFYPIPIFLMLFTFIATAHQLWGKRDNTTTDPEGVQETHLTRRRKAVKLLGGLILVFLVFWGPAFIHWAVIAIIPESSDVLRSELRCAFIFLGLLNTVANPIVYALRSEEFNRGIRKTGNEMASVLGFAKMQEDFPGVSQNDSQ